jgi:hypothetical protein
MYTSQDISVVPGYGEGVVYISVTAFLVLKEERRMVECCQFAKSMVIISVNTPFGSHLAKL